MSLKDQISADLKEAMKARDQLRVDTLRSAISALNYKRTEVARDLSPDEEFAVMQKQVKQRNDSITEFTKGGREELAQKEAAERDILAKYLPEQKSEAEVREIVQALIADLPPDGRNQGAVMKPVMQKLKGLADGNVIRQIVTEELGRL